MQLLKQKKVVIAKGLFVHVQFIAWHVVPPDGCGDSISPPCPLTEIDHFPGYARVLNACIYRFSIPLACKAVVSGTCTSYITFDLLFAPLSVSLSGEIAHSNFSKSSLSLPRRPIMTMN